MMISVVIPAYNEEEVIGDVVNLVKSKVNHVIVVDDGSTDATSYQAKKVGAFVVNHSINRGQGAALQTGINFALGQSSDIIVTFDADNQHLADEIDDIIQPLLLGEVDVVLGSRFIKENNIPLAKTIVLKIATFITRFYTGMNITDTHNGFRAFSRKAASLIDISQDGMAHASEIIEEIKKHRLKYKEVPVTINYTSYSKHKGQKLSSSFSILWDLIIGRLIK